MDKTIDFESLGIKSKLLDEKKEQTTYKTKYVKEYVENWLCVVSKEKKFLKINFIDCMCNAGVYKDGDPCTSILVIELFCKFAKSNPAKLFNVYLNDIDKERVDASKNVIRFLFPKIDNIINLKIYFEEQDVNCYLTNQSYNNSFKSSAATVLYVDPYDFGTVKINNITNFLKYNYSELLFNVFTMDFVRNANDERIKKCIDCSKIIDKADLMDEIAKMLKVPKIKYSFSYQFKNQNNTELYQIFYSTPNIRGLEKLKEAIWKVFKGKRFHRNKRVGENEQICLFTEEDDEKYFLRIYSEEAKDLLMNTFKKNTVTYNQIETLILEKTMLRKGHIIENVIKPLIMCGKIIKLGKVQIKSNYTKDYYEIVGDENEDISEKKYAIQNRS